VIQAPTIDARDLTKIAELPPKAFALTAALSRRTASLPRARRARNSVRPRH
jgi:hypothetical protein